MKKIIIVDDEKMIRLGIKMAIDWEKLGIDDVLLASGAGEALELVEKLKPQLMICDINMPEMNGLELIERIRVFVPDMKIIVLTGYDSFEFVRESLRLHADDFFLKPVDEDALFERLKVLVKAIDSEEKQKVIQNIYTASGQLYTESLFRRIVRGKALKDEIDTFLESRGFYKDERLKTVIVVPAVRERKPDDISLMEYEIKDICMGMLKLDSGEVLFTDTDRNTVLIMKKGKENDDFSVRLRQISSVLEMEFGAPPRMYLGGTVDGYYQLMSSYNDACAVRNESGCIEAVKVSREDDGCSKWRQNYMYIKQRLLEHLSDADRVRLIWRRFENEVKNFNLLPETVEKYCFELACAVYYAQFDKIEEKEENRLEHFLSAVRHGERDDILLLTRVFIEKLLRGSSFGETEVISRAKAYIHEHLTENLSVANIAAYLYITPNYFSRLFKSMTGEGCNDYIVRKRIDRAKKMLEDTNMKTGKIADAVGYHDANYFSLAFKKCTGVSPTRYREMKRGIYK